MSENLKNNNLHRIKSTFLFSFTMKNIAIIAMLSSLSTILYCFCRFPLPFLFPGFLDMQFSDLPAMLGGFALGPIAGSLIILVKTGLKLIIIPTSTQFVGEVADMIIGLSFVLVSSLIYSFFRTKKSAILSIIISTVCAIIVALLANRFYLLPKFSEFYGWNAIINMVKSLYPAINEGNFYSYYLPLAALPFNALRLILCATLTYFTYKPLSKALKWEREKKAKD